MEPTQGMTADLESRCRAMTDFSALLLVEAAAGTGKTSLLAGRVAMMLASGRAPSEIAAITFTDLAASELGRRIRQTVEELLAGKVPAFMQAALPGGVSATQRACLAEALETIDELTTSTIHSFCQAILRSHGVEADLDPGARVVDKAAADVIFETELSAWFARHFDQINGPEHPVVVLAREEPLKVVGRIRKLARLRREHSSAQPPRPAAGFRPDIAFLEAVNDFSRWQSSTLEDGWAAEIAADLEKLAVRYQDLFVATPTFSALWRLREPGNSRVLAEESLGLLSYRDAARALGAPDRVAANEPTLARYENVDRAWRTLIGHIASWLIWSLSSSLDDLLAGYRERKRAAAVLDFDDLLLEACRLVRSHEAVRQAVARRYKFILVDEFQDTDRVQTNVLFTIASVDRPERWEEARLRPGALFLVGDPKQAIYRFRGADIEAYELARNVILRQHGGDVLEVTANFRSQKPIIEHVNGCFEPVLSKPSQPRYVALTPTLPSNAYGVPCVTRFTIELEGKKLYADMFREAEAKKVAEICARLVGNVVITRPDKSRSPLRAGDIALLSPSHTELWRYERALEKYKLPVSSQAGQSLMWRQETQDVLALVRVIADSSDTLAFGALMRGPLVGLSDQELLDITAALTASNPDARYFTVRTDPSKVPHTIARAVLEDLQALRRRAGVTAPALLLAEAFERLNVRVILAARHGHRSARALANLDAIIERARSYGVAGLRAFVRDLNADWEVLTKVSEGRIDDNEDAVACVTMHSAKGLEWPVVIPINSTTELYRGDEFVHRQSDDTLHWMLGGVAPPELASARAEEGEQEARQRERLWYVACTRARDLLILPNIPQAASASWFKSIHLRQRDVPELRLADLPSNPSIKRQTGENGQTTEIFAMEQRSVLGSAPAINWRRPSAHDPERLGEVLERVVANETHGERVEAPGAGRLRGLILHKLMEELLTEELLGNEEAVSARADALLVELASERDAQEALPDPAEMARTALRTWNLPEIASLRPHLVLELAVWSSDDDMLVAGRADAVSVRDGRIEAVIDWKSDVDISPSVRASYVGQLQTYIEATGARRGALVFMSHGEVAWQDNAQLSKNALSPEPLWGGGVGPLRIWP
jgi:CRISPR-associated exonuclease Cas4